MSEDLIRRKDAIKAIDECYALLARLRVTARRALEAVPSADRPTPTHGYMWICPKCGLDVHSDFDRCVRCGYERADRPRGAWLDSKGRIMFSGYSANCSVCGEWSEYLTEYCGHCGARMKGADDED